MGYYPQYKLSSYYTDTISTFSPPGSMLVRKSGELICLNYQFTQGLSNLVNWTCKIVFQDDFHTQNTYTESKGVLYWGTTNGSTDLKNLTKWDNNNKPTTACYLYLYFSSGHIESLYNESLFITKWEVKTLNTSIHSNKNENLFKQFFLERGFSDLYIDYHQASVDYCRIDVTEDGHPIFMWPEGAEVKLYLSPYFALGRNEDGTEKDGQVSLFATPNTKITNFYSVQFLYGGLSSPYYGTGAIGEEEDGRLYVIPPLVGYGADELGVWYRLDLTYVQFLFETPFTTNVDIQNYLRRKYLATRSNGNSTDNSKYSGYCSMSELATMMGFSNIEHSNNAKSAINTPVKIYEKIVDNKVCYGVCFGKENHDNTTMAGYSNLLEGDEYINFIQTNNNPINLKWWRWNSSSGSNKEPGAGDWVKKRISQTFSKSTHYVERAEYDVMKLYTDLTIDNDITDINKALESIGAQDISETESWTYDSENSMWLGSSPITFTLPNIQGIKTGGTSSPQNLTYSFADNNGRITLSPNQIIQTVSGTKYAIQLNSVALYRAVADLYLYNGVNLNTINAKPLSRIVNAIEIVEGPAPDTSDHTGPIKAYTTPSKQYKISQGDGRLISPTLFERVGITQIDVPRYQMSDSNQQYHIVGLSFPNNRFSLSKQDGQFCHNNQMQLASNFQLDAKYWSTTPHLYPELIFNNWDTLIGNAKSSTIYIAEDHINIDGTTYSLDSDDVVIWYVRKEGKWLYNGSTLFTNLMVNTTFDSGQITFTAPQIFECPKTPRTFTISPTTNYSTLKLTLRNDEWLQKAYVTSDVPVSFTSLSNVYDYASDTAGTVKLRAIIAGAEGEWEDGFFNDTFIPPTEPFTTSNINITLQNFPQITEELTIFSSNNIDTDSDKLTAGDVSCYCKCDCKTNGDYNAGREYYSYLKLIANFDACVGSIPAYCLLNKSSDAEHEVDKSDHTTSTLDKVIYPTPTWDPEHYGLCSHYYKYKSTISADGLGSTDVRYQAMYLGYIRKNTSTTQALAIVIWHNGKSLLK